MVKLEIMLKKVEQTLTIQKLQQHHGHRIHGIISLSLEILEQYLEDLGIEYM
tara:strand:- start:257 stop:412 length:156 start_codon:yes stop_codon:yes gene_type:complete